MAYRKLLGKSLRIRILELLALCGPPGPSGLNAYELSRELDVSHGSLYPALARIVAAEEVDVIVERERRHGQVIKRYMINETGKRAAREALNVRSRVAGRQAVTQVAGSARKRSKAPRTLMPEPW